MIHAIHTIKEFSFKHYHFQYFFQSSFFHDIRFSAYNSFFLFVCREHFVYFVRKFDSSYIFVLVISKSSFFAFVELKQASRKKLCMLYRKRKIVTKNDESKRMFDECNSIDVKDCLWIMIVNRNCAFCIYLLFVCSSINRRCEIRIHDLKRVICCARTRTRVCLFLPPREHCYLLLFRRFETSRLCYNKVTGS